MLLLGTQASQITDYIYIVDQITGSCQSAYSVRKLLSAYSGSCIRVRRSSDNAEQDIGFVDNILDISSLLSFVGANSAYITKWYDQSGNSRDAVQATTSLQPRIVSTGTLDKNSNLPDIPGLRWYQVNLSLPAYKFAAPSNAFTASFVGSVDNPIVGNGNGSFGSDGNGFNSNGFYLNARSDFQQSSFAKSGTTYTASAAKTLTSNEIYTAMTTMTSSNIAKSYRNSTASSSVDVSTWTVGSKSYFDLGKYSVASSAAVDLIGYIFEHISWSSVISDDDIEILRHNQSLFYGSAN